MRTCEDQAWRTACLCSETGPAPSVDPPAQYDKGFDRRAFAVLPPPLTFDPMRVDDGPNVSFIREGKMGLNMRSRLLINSRTILFLGAVALAVAVFIVASVPAATLAAREKCAFNDGSTIAFGHEASGMPGQGADVWRAGDYEATAFVVSQRMQFAPLNGGLQVPVGKYTLFVDTSKQPPWTLIISKKSGRWGIPYPGEQYDLGRTRLGNDLLPRQRRTLL